MAANALAQRQTVLTDLLEALHASIGDEDMEIEWMTPPQLLMKEIGDAIVMDDAILLAEPTARESLQNARRATLYDSLRPPDVLQWILDTRRIAHEKIIDRGRFEALRHLMLPDLKHPQGGPGPTAALHVSKALTYIFEACTAGRLADVQAAALACLRALWKRDDCRNTLSIDEARTLAQKCLETLRGRFQSTRLALTPKAEMMKLVATLGSIFVDGDLRLQAEYIRNIYTDTTVAPFLQMTDSLLDEFCILKFTANNQIDDTSAERAAAIAAIARLAARTKTYRNSLTLRPKHIKDRFGPIDISKIGIFLAQDLIALRNGKFKSYELPAKILRLLHVAPQHVALATARRCDAIDPDDFETPLNPWPLFELLAAIAVKEDGRVHPKIAKHAAPALEASLEWLALQKKDPVDWKPFVQHIADLLLTDSSHVKHHSISWSIRRGTIALAARACAAIAHGGMPQEVASLTEHFASLGQNMSAKLFSKSILFSVRSAGLLAAAACLTDVRLLGRVTTLAVWCIEAEADQVARLGESHSSSSSKSNNQLRAILEFVQLCQRIDQAEGGSGQPGHSALRVVCRRGVIAAAARHGGDTLRLNPLTGHNDDRVCFELAKKWQLLFKACSYSPQLSNYLYGCLWRAIVNDIVIELDLRYTWLSEHHAPLPRNAFDQEILINLAGFVMALHSDPAISALRLSNSVNLEEEDERLLTMSKRRPHVSALYRLATLVVNVNTKRVQKYVPEVARLCATFDGELLDAACQVVLAFPTRLAAGQLAQLAVAVRAALRSGRIPLARAAMGTIEGWLQDLPEEVDTEVMPRLIPLLDRYARANFQNTAIPETLAGGSSHASRQRRAAAAAKRLNTQLRASEAVTTELSKRVLRLYARLGPTARAAAAGDARSALRQSLSWSPQAGTEFGTVRLEIENYELSDAHGERSEKALVLHLDQLMPRLAELAASPAGDRQTRLVAAEAFHASLITAIGYTYTLAGGAGSGLIQVFKNALPVIIALAADEDPVIRTLFQGQQESNGATTGLLPQLTHYLSRPDTLRDGKELHVLGRDLVSALADAAVADDDNDNETWAVYGAASARRRDVAAAGLAEFFAYVVKQGNEVQDFYHFDALENILSRVLADLGHPELSARRRGGALIAQRLIRHIRKSKCLVSRFSLALLRSALAAIEHSSFLSKNQKPGEDHIDYEAAVAASILAKRLQIVICHWLIKEDTSGSHDPAGLLLESKERFEPSTLAKLVNWIWRHGCGHPDHAFRRRCWYTIDKLAGHLLNPETSQPVASFKLYALPRLLTSDKRRAILQHDTSSAKAIGGKLAKMTRLSATLQTYAIFVSCEFVPIDAVLQDEAIELSRTLAEVLDQCARAWEGNLKKSSSTHIVAERSLCLRRGAEFLVAIATKRREVAVKLIVDSGLWSERARQSWLQIILAPDDGGVLPSADEDSASNDAFASASASTNHARSSDDLARAVSNLLKLAPDLDNQQSSRNLLAASLRALAEKHIPSAWCGWIKLAQDFNSGDFAPPSSISSRDEAAAVHRLLSTLAEAGILEYTLSSEGLSRFRQSIGRIIVARAELFPWRRSKDALDLAVDVISMDPATLLQNLLDVAVGQSSSFYEHNARHLHMLLLRTADIWNRASQHLIDSLDTHPIAARIICGVLDHYRIAASDSMDSNVLLSGLRRSNLLPLDIISSILAIIPDDHEMAVVHNSMKSALEKVNVDADRDHIATAVQGIRLLQYLASHDLSARLFSVRSIVSPSNVDDQILVALDSCLRKTIPLRHDEFQGIVGLRSEHYVRQRAFDDILTALCSTYADTALPEILDRLVSNLNQIERRLTPPQSKSIQKSHVKEKVMRAALRDAARRHVSKSPILLIDLFRRLGVFRTTDFALVEFDEDVHFSELLHSGHLTSTAHVRKQENSNAMRVLVEDLLKPAIKRAPANVIVALAKCRLLQSAENVSAGVSLITIMNEHLKCGDNSSVVSAAAAFLEALFIHVHGLSDVSGTSLDDTAIAVAELYCKDTGKFGNDAATDLRQNVLKATMPRINAAKNKTDWTEDECDLLCATIRIRAIVGTMSYKIKADSKGILEACLPMVLGTKDKEQKHAALLTCFGALPQFRFDRQTYTLSVAAAYFERDRYRKKKTSDLPGTKDNEHSQGLGAVACQMLSQSSLGDGLIQGRRRDLQRFTNDAHQHFPASLDGNYNQTLDDDYADGDDLPDPSDDGPSRKRQRSLNSIMDLDDDHSITSEQSISSDGDNDERNLVTSEFALNEDLDEDNDEEQSTTSGLRITSRKDMLFLSVDIVDRHPCMKPIVEGVKQILMKTNDTQNMQHCMRRITRMLEAASDTDSSQDDAMRCRRRNASIFTIQLVLSVIEDIPTNYVDVLRIPLAKAATICLGRNGAPGIDFLLRQVVELLTEDPWSCQEADNAESLLAYRHLAVEILRLAPYTGKDRNAVTIDPKYRAIASYQRVTSDNVKLFHKFATANKDALLHDSNSMWWEEHIYDALVHDEGGDARIGRHHASPQSEGAMRVVVRRCGLGLVSVLLELTADNGASILRSPRILSAIMHCAASAQDRRLVYVGAGEFIGSLLSASKNNMSEDAHGFKRGVRQTIARLGQQDPSKVRYALFASLAKFASGGNYSIADRSLCNVALDRILDCATTQRAELLSFLHFAARPSNGISHDELLSRLADKVDDLFSDTARKEVTEIDSNLTSSSSDSRIRSKPVVSIALLELLKFRIDTLAGHSLCSRIIHDGTNALARTLPGYRDSSHRKLGYELLADLYSAYFPPQGSDRIGIVPFFEETPGHVRNALLGGLADPDDTGMHDIQRRKSGVDVENIIGCRRFVYDFWRARLPESPQNRLDALLREVFTCADALPQRYAVSLLLSHASHSMTRKKLFRAIEGNKNNAVQLLDHYLDDGPSLTLESVANLSSRSLKSLLKKRKHDDIDITSSLEKTSQFVDLFAQRRPPAGMVLASVKDSLADFSATQMSAEGRSVVLPSQLLFQGHQNGDAPASLQPFGEIIPAPSTEKASTKKRVRFADNSESAEDVRSNLVVYREYRPGEQPDVEITLADVVRPLAAAALRDGELAAALFTQIFIQMYAGRTTERRRDLIIDMQKILEHRSASGSAELVSTVHGCLLQIISIESNFIIPVPATTIAESATRARVAESGAVLLEALINTKMRRPGQSDDAPLADLIELRRLYAGYQDHDAELVVCDALLGHGSEKVRLGIAAESSGDYDAAYDLYVEEYGDDAYAKRLADGRAIKLALKLGYWTAAVENCVAAGDPTATERLWVIPSSTDTTTVAFDAAETLRTYVSALVLENEEGGLRELITKVRSTEEIQQWTAINTPCALALAYATCSNDLPNARRSIDAAYEVLSTNWAATHACAIAARTECLRELTHISEIEYYLNACQHEDSLTSLIQAWSATKLSPDDPEENWMRSRRTREVLVREIASKSDEYRQALCNHIHQLTSDGIEYAIDRLQVDVAERFLSFVDKKTSPNDSRLEHLKRSLILAKARRLALQPSDTPLQKDTCRNAFCNALKYLPMNMSEAVIKMEFADALAHSIASPPADYASGLEAARRMVLEAALLFVAATSGDSAEPHCLFTLAEMADSAISARLDDSVAEDAVQEVIIDEIWKETADPIAESVKCAISNYVRALVLGDRAAKSCAIPRILTLLTCTDLIAERAIEEFAIATRHDLLPLDTLLPWAYRFMSLTAERDEKGRVTDVEFCKKLESTLTRLAQEGPTSLHSPLRFAVERLQDRGLYTRSTITFRLATQCRSEHLDTFVIALQGLQEPALRYETALKQLYQVLAGNGTQARRESLRQGGESNSDYKLRAAHRIWTQLYEELLAEEWPGVMNYLGDKNKEFGKRMRRRLTSGSLHLHFLGDSFNGDLGDELIRGGKLVPKTSSDADRTTAETSVRALLYDTTLKKLLNKDRTESLRFLAQVSTYLQHYDGSQNPQAALDVPLPAWELVAISQSVPKISKFNSSVKYLPSMRRPCKLSAACSDGTERSFLVKSGEDLRNDERIEHIFNTMRVVIKSTPATRQKKLHAGLRTYGVVPLSPRVGLVEWMNDAETFSAVVERYVPDKARRKAHEARCKYLNGMNIGNNEFSKYLNAMKEITPDSGYQAFMHAQEVLEPYAAGRATPLSRYLITLAPQSEAFVNIRHNFIKSVATSSACTYIVGLGDRHQGNIMLNSRDGTIAHIDLGASFGYGTTLPIPELMPIRFTPQLASPLAPLDGKSVAQRHLSDALGAFRNRKYVPTLSAMLDLFATDPVLDWIQASDKYNPVSTEELKSTDLRRVLTPKKRVKIAREKLLGRHPTDLLEQEISYNPLVNSHHATIGIKKLYENVTPRCHRSHKISPEEQANVLIKLASDPALLSVHYAGLETWW